MSSVKSPLLVTSPRSINHVFPLALLLSLLLHILVIQYFSRPDVQSASPIEVSESRVRVQLLPETSADSEAMLSSPHTAVASEKPPETEGPDVEAVQTTVYPAIANKPLLTQQANPNPAEVIEPRVTDENTSQDRKTAVLSVPLLASEALIIIEPSVPLIECTPQQRESEVHQCDEEKSDRWQSVGTNVYDGAWRDAFRHLDRGDMFAAFSRDMKELDRLIDIQEAVYAKTESIGEVPDILMQEQRRISQQIEGIYAKYDDIDLIRVISFTSNAVGEMMGSVSEKN
ncbi:MAG: hypothetical protein AAF699_20760 [Pseudomonadota bacterium]